jgi:hypothetical protein
VNKARARLRDEGKQFYNVGARFHLEETKLRDESFPALDLLLEVFEHRPELVEEEDKLSSSPGMILHYFASFNYLR